MNLKKIAGNVASNFSAAYMGSANEQYLNSISPMEKAKILKAIAAHYGVSVREMEDEVTDREAEALYEYLSFDNGMAMKVYRDFKSQRIASEMTAGCEKLPEALRENCEKKKGEKKEAGEVPEAFKKEWKNNDKDNDGKENEPKPEFLKDKKSSMADRIAEKLIQGGCEKLQEGAMRDNCEKKKKEASRKTAGVLEPLADAFARYLIGDRQVALAQLKQMSNKQFSDVPMGSEEYNAVYEDVYGAILKVLRAKL